MLSPIEKIRNIVREILEQRNTISFIACQQRAKFEGWLKFAIAGAIAKDSEFSNITIEDGYPKTGRSDFSFIYNTNLFHS